ncbi:MAG: hypothetical protein PWP37_1350, partial [Thermotogota bacterium]|nr:hypothetical protein [Thermotogota bacterium]
MLKILTFLGTGSYKSNTIRINGFTRIHKIFPIALAEYKLLNVPKESLELIFFLTPESKAHENWNEHTKPHLDCMKIKYRVVDITADINPIELVRKMMEVVNEGDEVILDTTHSFRSIPITAAIISLYLREAKNVNVRIFYGLYDGVSKFTEALDLTNVIDMADWLYAARLFKEYGYSKPLGKLVKERNSSIRTNPDIKEKPEKLSKLQGDLQNLSTALRLGSIRSIREYVRKLIALFEGSQHELMGELERFAPELYPLVPSML